MKRRVFELALLVLTWVFGAGHASAKELDQFTDRLRVLHYYQGGWRDIPGAPSPAQVDAILDARMNLLLDQLLAALQNDPPPTAAARDRLVRSVFQHRYLPELITPYEEWAKHDAPLPLYKVRDKGIYGHAVDYDDMRMTWYIELSPIVQVAGVLIGIDKLGHYLAQGFQYYEEYQRLGDGLAREERARQVREYGHVQEVRQLGIATGGVYSFADLAANWAGMLFFLSLFDDVKLEGAEHARYFSHDSAGYHRVRDFHWAEWIASDWDEVQNPAFAEQRVLFEKVRANFRRSSGAPGSVGPSICDEYRKDPRAFIGPITAPKHGPYALPEVARHAAAHALDVGTLCGGESVTTVTNTR